MFKCTAEYVVLVLVLLCLTSVLSITGSVSFTVVKFVVQKKPQPAETGRLLPVRMAHIFASLCYVSLHGSV